MRETRVHTFVFMVAIRCYLTLVTGLSAKEIDTVRSYHLNDRGDGQVL